MIQMLKNLFKGTDYKGLVAEGAIIIDVRTPGEYKAGHINGSKNIPLDTISKKVGSISKMNKVIILCCQSGMRSGQATGILKSQGIEAYNGGGWSSLNSQL